ncbi:hypothetical protein WN51_11275 [Melipona quadrifasciata]|uniref:Uncharacterized protein n=1 Tax=Melipona quadrifasciata TaxID=166423 RepID=A0A0M9A464_9HYME|nr:hypothetical protein WN51_11275 [Melipona quadrifasciata]
MPADLDGTGGQTAVARRRGTSIELSSKEQSTDQTVNVGTLVGAEITNTRTLRTLGSRPDPKFQVLAHPYTLVCHPRIQKNKGECGVVGKMLRSQKNSARNSRRRRVSEGASRDKDGESNLSTRQEDRENKGPPSGRPSNRIPRTVLEEANSASSSAAKLRKRGTAVKSPVESASQRPVRRRPRLGCQGGARTEAEEDVVDVKSAEKEERLSGARPAEEEDRANEVVGEENEDREIGCDPLTKRLRTSPVGRKLRSERKGGSKLGEEAASDIEGTEEEEGDRKEKSAGGEAARSEKLEENEASQSRERDREPEPPPPDKVDPGGDTVLLQRRQSTNGSDRTEERFGTRADARERRCKEQQPQVLVNGSVLDSSPLSVVDKAASVLLTTELGTEDSVGSVSGARAASVESVVELLESSSQDSGSVLERLSPLMEAGAGIPGNGVLAGVPAAVGIRAVGTAAGSGAASAAYGDSGSDSGVSSLRSAGSGDERSGSRTAAAAAAATAPPVGYQSPAPPPPGHHHPAVASEMLWRSQRYPPLPHSLLGPAQPTTEEIVERERMIRPGVAIDDQRPKFLRLREAKDTDAEAKNLKLNWRNYNRTKRVNRAKH